MVTELQVARHSNARLWLDGIAVTRVDPRRAGTPRELEVTFGLAPPRAFFGPLVPEGAGPAREGAIEELAGAWARRAGVVLRARGGADRGLVGNGDEPAGLPRRESRQASASVAQVSAP